MAFPLPTLAAQVTPTGISAPSFSDILTSLQTSARQIFGSDAYLEPDSQDGQLLGLFARAIHDCNQTAIAVYNSFSPQTAQGEGLSNVVKINHIKRLVPSNSTVNVDIVGQVGTLILNGVVGDIAGNRWTLPASVTIPPDGTVTVTATAVEAGAIGSPIGTLINILTPTAGWASVTNSSAGALGNPVESDGQLRIRQEQSPSFTAVATLRGLAASIVSIPGVTYGVVYENDTNSTDTNGLPAHSISVVVRGGDADTIANTIYNKKAPGVATYGTTTIAVIDATGTSRNINYYVPTEIGIRVAISLTALDGYTTAVTAEIKAAIVDFIAALSVGEDVVVNRLYTPALLLGSLDSEKYKITALTAGLAPAGSLGTTDIAISFIQKAICDPADIAITVV